MMIKLMTNNKDAAKAADYVKKFKHSQTDYPDLKERLEKNCVRYFERAFEWFKIEELLIDSPRMLG